MRAQSLSIIILVCYLLLPSRMFSQAQTVSEDKDWTKQQVIIHGSSEADYIVRIGDVDNLGFGWPEGFDPFCGLMTETHIFPWDIHSEDLPGFDRILLSSKFNPSVTQNCGADGYSYSFNKVNSKPVTYNIPTAELKDAEIKNAFLQIFIDDFQAPSFCSKFQMFINGKRFVEGERVLNAIDQTGPVGKLISIPIPEEFYQLIVTNASVAFKIDEQTGAADGFAIDFIRLLINRHRENSCKGDVHGKVLEKNTEKPIGEAMVSLADKTSVTSNQSGEFSLHNIPTGFEVISASAKGYSDGASAADIGVGNNNPEVIIYLEPGKKSAQFQQKTVTVGEAIVLNNIMFAQGKFDLNEAAKSELDKVADFLRNNSNAEIELSGHTSSEGEAMFNRSLSYKRVKACKDYIISKGFESGRILASGYGPDRPAAPNDTEANRAKNRRVEMRVTKL